MLPDLIGERVGLLFDCFLANTFTSILVKDMMPVSSDTIPIITRFMLMCMVLIFLSLLTSSFSLVCRMRVKMPKFIRKIFIEFLGPLMLVSECSSIPKACLNSEDDNGFPLDELPPPRIPWYHQTSDSDVETSSYETTSFSSGYPGTSENSYRVSSKSGSRYDRGYRRARTNRAPFSSGYNSLESQPKPSQHQKECLKNIETLVKGVQDEITDANNKDFWDFVSKIADRFFLVIFVITWILMASFLFLKIPVHANFG